jgi:ribonuclease HI
MITVYTDAAAKGKTGDAAIGIIIQHGHEQSEYAFYLGSYNNHDAEFMAVIKALELCRAKHLNEIISVRTDSKVVVDTLEKNYAKNEQFRTYLLTLKELESNFSYVFYKWIPDKQNRRADDLAKKCLQQHQS